MILCPVCGTDPSPFRGCRCRESCIEFYPDRVDLFFGRITEYYEIAQTRLPDGELFPGYVDEDLPGPEDEEHFRQVLLETPVRRTMLS